MSRRTTFRWMALSAALVGNSAVLFALARPITDYVATLAGKDGRKVHGTATVTPTKDGTGTEVSVTLADDTLSGGLASNYTLAGTGGLNK